MLNTNTHVHCWHIYTGAIWMVIPEGCVVEECCTCRSTRVRHLGHSKHNKKPTWKNNRGNLNAQ